MSHTRFRLLALTAALTMLMALMVAPAGAAPSDVPADTLCPAVADPASLAEGDTVETLSVVTGQDPTSISGVVVGVLEDAVGPGRDLVLADFSGNPSVDRAGIWAGMSGSPVYTGGKIVGAISYVFALGPSPLAGITPAQDMLNVLDYPNQLPFATDAPQEVEGHLSRSERRALAESSGRSLAATPSTVRGRQLRIPVGISGLSGRRLASASRHYERMGLPFVVSGAASGGSSTQQLSAAQIATTIRPGGNIAAALSYGDVNFAGVGTTTMRCNGRALAFGHHFFFSGQTEMSMHTAEALRIVVDPLLGGFKMANIGGIAGRLKQDRLAAIAGPLGQGPAVVPIRTQTRVRRHDGSVDRAPGSTFVAYRDWLPDIAIFHQWATIDTLRDAYAEGSAKHTWTVRGRYRGAPFVLQRTNRFVSDYDVTGESVWELYENLYRLQNFGPVRITNVNVDNDILTEKQTYRITGVRVFRDGRYRPVSARQPVIARPGRLLRLRLRLLDADNRIVRKVMNYRVPIRQQMGRGQIQLRGGGSDYGYYGYEDCFFGECSAGNQSLDKIIERMENALRNDQMVVNTRVNYRGSRRFFNRATRVRFDRVITGRAVVPLFIIGGAPRR